MLKIENIEKIDRVDCGKWVCVGVDDNNITDHYLFNFQNVESYKKITIFLNKVATKKGIFELWCWGKNGNNISYFIKEETIKDISKFILTLNNTIEHYERTV
jgi:hypothetical protein